MKTLLTIALLIMATLAHCQYQIVTTTGDTLQSSSVQVMPDKLKFIQGHETKGIDLSSVAALNHRGLWYRTQYAAEPAYQPIELFLNNYHRRQHIKDAGICLIAACLAPIVFSAVGSTMQDGTALYIAAGLSFSIFGTVSGVNLMKASKY